MNASHRLRLAAPAKVNLGLWVGGARPDGFHDITTVILPLEFGDTVELALRRSGIRLRCDCPGVPEDESNLAWQAARLLLDTVRSPAGCAIRITKRVPPGAGLGGGSADAAAVLRGLNRLLGEPLSLSRLLRLGARLGSDVPALVLGRPCAARGRGERLRPLRLPALNIILCLPGFGVSTRWAYNRLDRSRPAGLTGPPMSPKILAARLRNNEPERAARLVRNSFEPVVFARHPRLRRACRLLLDSGCAAAGLSGSGSTVYGLVSGPVRDDPMAALARLGFRAITTRSLPSPDRLPGR
ncbi:4-(cytidine 5'-diphospho)-2-C-methyl-D-erythritol kinase [candidate division WOR-3 bacterium]|nr:4-(cytidine 5'-diphospho)-2-C-methyl-D-erythritol kinase [candidate division WOR-3 bacterium]